MPMPRRHSTQADARADQERATALAQTFQMRAATEDRQRDVQALEHEDFLRRLDRIGRDAPAVRTAWVLLDQHTIHPVPLDVELEPAGEPLTTVDAVLEHYQAHPRHGVGITTGKHPIRPWTYLAVKVDRFQSWTEWLRAAAAVTEKVPDLGGFADMGGMAEVGPPTEKKTYRDTGAYSRLLWVPPPLPRMKTWKTDAAGGDLVRHLQGQKFGRGGWIWLAVPDPDGDIDVRKDLQVTDGVRLLATGTVVPWEGSRTADGWALRMESARGSQDGLRPSQQPPQGWLVDKLTNSRKAKR